eukprot:TRINITY_DN11236_c0_g1_i1.p1 TRINITY_DN11236_c0_g1~~TRINITY_DN11236_c0_g1_i1.p1  ORF type:complete len:887 (+),score=245.99 TRINITY_DN11236_c0_g1_i1:1629-4289(+)
MPLVKNYLRYEASGRYGVIASGSGNAVYLATQQLIASPALEDVIIWNAKTGEQTMKLEGDEHMVTFLCVNHKHTHLAVGYNNGIIQLWSLKDGSVSVVFSGHRSSVTTMAFSRDDAQLVSGSQDTDVIVWDIVNESGLYRLRGHKGPIYDVHWIEDRNLLVSCSKDALVRFWDLDTQACVHTLVGHRTEVTGMVFMDDHQRMITCAGDNQLRVWQLGYAKRYQTAMATEEDHASEGEQVEELANPIVTELQGSIERSTLDKALGLKLSQDGRMLVCYSGETMVDMYRIRTEDELKKRLARKKKKAKTDGDVTLELADEIVHAGCLKAQGKVKAIDLCADASDANKHHAAVTLASNAIETHTLTRTGKGVDATRTSYLSLGGHRKPIRSIALSSDERLVATTSNSTAKVWNRLSGRCVRTLQSGYGLTVAFVPGNKHLLVGTKDGYLRLYEIASGELLHEQQAHDGALWSIALTPDEQGFVTGSADKTVKFWDYELESEAGALSKKLAFVHTRTLKMTDEVTCVCMSANQKLLAIALLDTTVKVFYADSLKFFLSLYGHKLPVLCMDMSADSTLLATGSADKNLKIWGLDFGDCHKSFLAHVDTVTSVKFAGTSHYVFSTAKDGSIKQWDADVFTQIQSLEGHKDGVTCSAIGPKGFVFVTGSHDRSVRVWLRSREMLNVDEELELERDAEYEREQAEREAMEARANADEDEAGKATKRSAESMKAADKLLEALQLVIEEDAKGPDAPVNPIFLAFRATNSLDYLRHTLESVPSSELEEAALLLPYTNMTSMLNYLHRMIQAGQSVEKASRCLFFLLRVHHNQMLADRQMLPLLDKLRTSAKTALSQQRDLTGFNLAGLKFLKQQLQENGRMVDVAPKAKKTKTITA